MRLAIGEIQIYCEERTRIPSCCNSITCRRLLQGSCIRCRSHPGWICITSNAHLRVTWIRHRIVYCVVTVCTVRSLPITLCRGIHLHKRHICLWCWSWSRCRGWCRRWCRCRCWRRGWGWCRRWCWCRCWCRCWCWRGRGRGRGARVWYRTSPQCCVKSVDINSYIRTIRGSAITR